MLRRRYHPQTKIAGETEGRKETDEKHRENQHSAGGIHRGTQSAMSLEIRDSSTPLRFARNDMAAGGGVHRGAQSAMNLFVMSTEVETSLDSTPELARDSSTSLG